jgi:hypothetical protein
MKMKRKMILAMALFFAVGWTFFPQAVQADMESRLINDLNLKATPLDMASSADGQWIFILTPGEILVYSLQEKKITDQIRIGKDFDRLISLPGANTLTIASKSKKVLQILALEMVYKVDVTGSPFKGPQDAPVTIAVFSDYQ